MTASFVVRLMDYEDNLLSWASVHGQAKSQPGRASGLLQANPPVTRFVIERDGVASKVAVHWTDLDVARVRAIDATPVQIGQVMEFMWLEPVWLVLGQADVPLPAVTVRRPVSVSVPHGGIGAKDTRT